jgi:hypothetical protein
LTGQLQTNTHYEAVVLQCHLLITLFRREKKLLSVREAIIIDIDKIGPNGIILSELSAKCPRKS